MGEILTRVRLENSADLSLEKQGTLAADKVRGVEIDAVVDTGAVMMLLPQDLVEKLGLPVYDKVIVALADETKIELDRAGDIRITVAGRRMTADCLVGPPGCEPLIGQLIMEGLDLIPDPLKRTLTPRPESPYLPTLKLKPCWRAIPLS